MESILSILNEVLDFVNYWTQSPAYIALLFGRVVVFGLLVFAFYSFIDYMQKFSVVSNMVNRTITQTSAQEKMRMEQAYRLRRDSGAQEKTSFIYRLDLLILQSGIKRYFKWINTQIFIFLLVFASTVGMIATITITDNSSFGIGVFLIVAFVLYGIIRGMANVNYKRVEKSLVSFANIAENFSKSSDDLITILDRVSWYVEEPLKSAIRTCVQRAKNSGDTLGAIQQLQLEIEHPQFRQLIRNLEVASRHEANYAEIIEDNRKTLQEYMKFQQEKEAIYANGRTELAVVLFAGIMCLFMVQDLGEMTIYEIYTTGIFGTFISIYTIATLAYIVYVMFFSSVKEKSGGDY